MRSKITHHIFELGMSWIIIPFSCLLWLLAANLYGLSQVTFWALSYLHLGVQTVFDHTFKIWVLWMFVCLFYLPSRDRTEDFTPHTGQNSTRWFWTLNQPHLFLVSGLVYFLLQNVHLLERLQAVDTVDQYKAIGHWEVVFREVLSIVEPFGVIKP